MIDGVPLSPQQQARWLDRGCARVLVRIDGALEEGRLAVALSRVIARHEMLRTRFHRDPRLRFPVQVVRPEATPSWRRVEAPLLDATWREAGHRAFDLERGPLLDVVLARIGDDRHALVITLPAVAADAWSLELVVRELAAAYDRGSVGDDPVQYAQLVEWQGQGEPPAFDAGAPPRLPFEGAPAGEPAAALVERVIDRPRTAQLVALAARHHVPLGAVLLATWQAQLARLVDRGELAVAVASPGRTFDDLRTVLGPIASWMPVACRVDDDLVVLLARAQRALEDAAAEEPHGADPADQIGFAVDELPPPLATRDLSWRIEARCAGGGGAKLALIAQPRGDHLHLAWWHDPRRYGPDAADVLAAQYLAALESVGTGRVGLVGAAERAQRLTVARATDAPLLHRAFERHAAAQPDQLALVCGDERLTYRELNERANCLAHHLRRRGVRPGTPVGLCCARTAGAIVGLLAILKAGGAYVPLDPQAPPHRLAEQCRQAAFTILLITSGVAASARDVIVVDDLVIDEPATDPAVDISANALASVVFTSGSTGAPKGVAITHGGIASYTASVCEALAIVPGLSFATVSTLSADLGNTSIFAALATGGCLHVIDYETATDGGRFAAYRRRWPIDVLKIVPSHLSALLDTDEPAAVLPRRLLVLGGEALPLALVDRVASLAPSCAVANHYGPTETTVGALALPLATLADRRGCASVPIGRALASAEAYVLDGDLELTTVGAVGELYVGGAGLARGYLGRPDLTAERFVPHPFATGARLYRTGDRARYRPDGTVEFMGRADHQVKIRGFRVELGEIEARLREHPAIAQAVATIRDGTAGPTVVAHVVPAGALDEPALRAFLQDRLPEHMIPAHLVRLATMPLTANGKIDRRALPIPAPERRPHVAPRTELEARIATIWADVLGLAQVSVEDDFFQLGGHSLLAIPLVHRIQRAVGGSLSLMAIFQAPTVAGLARLIDTAPAGLAPLRDAGSRPPLFCIDPTGRHASAYQPLADALDDRPVLAVELGPALADGASTRAIVERLTHVVRRRQPTGPYHLLGWSLGGVLALGVARALASHGERVAFLGIIDTQPRTELYAGGRPDPIDELAGYVDPDRRADLLALPPAELRGLRDQLATAGADELVAAAVTWAQARGFLPADAPAAAFAHRYQLLRDVALFLHELPRPCLDAPIYAWWSTETLARRGGPPVDWQAYTTASVQVATATGDHAAAIQGAEVHAAVRAVLAAI